MTRCNCRCANCKHAAGSHGTAKGRRRSACRRANCPCIKHVGCGLPNGSCLEKKGDPRYHKFWNRPPDQYHLLPTEWSYIAGIIDGEGCLGVYCLRSSVAQCRITIPQSTPEMLYWIRERLGGHIHYVPAKPPNRPYGRYGWGIYSYHESTEILRHCLPYLIVKKAQAEAILRYKPNAALARKVAELKRVHHTNP